MQAATLIVLKELSLVKLMKIKSSTYYLLEKAGNKTKLTLDFYLRKNITEEIVFKLMKKKKMENSLKKSLLNLEELVKEIKLPATIEDNSQQ